VPVNLMELIGPAFILAVIAAALSRSLRPAGRIGVAACASALVFVPVGSTTVGGFTLAIVGPVSAATIMLCAIYLRSILGPRKPHLPSRAFLLCIFATGVVFYPLTFGLTTFDPYDLGYRGLAVPALMLAYLLIGWIAGAADIPWWIGLTGLLYLLDANNSSNLWDYLLFPLDVIIAAFGLALAWHRGRQSVFSNACDAATSSDPPAPQSARPFGSGSLK
jgi:hypothetical protein